MLDHRAVSQGPRAPHLVGLGFCAQLGLGGYDVLQRGLELLHEKVGRASVDRAAGVVLLPPLPSGRVGAVFDGVGGAAGEELLDLAPAWAEERLRVFVSIGSLACPLNRPVDSLIWFC